MPALWVRIRAGEWLFSRFLSAQPDRGRNHSGHADGGVTDLVRSLMDLVGSTVDPRRHWTAVPTLSLCPDDLDGNRPVHHAGQSAVVPTGGAGRLPPARPPPARPVPARAPPKAGVAKSPGRGGQR